MCFPLSSSYLLTHAQKASVAESNVTASGVKLYQQGKFNQAVEVLRRAVKQRKDDAEAWLYLGLVLNRKENAKEARKAFERAVKLRPDSTIAHIGLAYTLLLLNKNLEANRSAEQVLQLDARNYEAHYIAGVVRLRNGQYEEALKRAESAIKLNDKYALAYLLKSQALIGIAASPLNTAMMRQGVSSDELRQVNSAAYENYKQAAESLENYLRLSPNVNNADEVREQLENIRIYGRSGETVQPERTLFRSTEVTTKAVVISKPEPPYTEAARQACVSGIVRLRAVLSSDSTVKHILVIKPLSHGLTEQAIRAARRVKFTPASKDGRPVSQYVVLEYSFRCG